MKMNVGELKKQLENIKDDNDVVVVVKDGSIVGGTPCVGVRSVSIGIDWDNGKLMLYTDKPLVRKGI
jgi:hypothetical protein